MESTTNMQDEVRRRAYELWEQHGSPEGREEEFWLQAEREISDKVPDRTIPDSPKSG
jgi:hypothetical protein